MRYKAERRVDKHLGRILIEYGVINEEQLNKALTIYKDRNGEMPTGKVLMELGYAKERDIILALNIQYRFPYLPIDNYNVNPDVLSLIPSHLARRHLLMPLDRIGRSLSIAMSNPLDAEVIAEIEAISKCCVQIFIATSSEILRAIDRCYSDN